MPARSTTTPATQAEWLAQRIKEHQEEVARFREEFGDPAEALNRFILEHFELEDLLPDGDRAIWQEDDDRSDW